MGDACAAAGLGGASGGTLPRTRFRASCRGTRGDRAAGGARATSAIPEGQVRSLTADAPAGRAARVLSALFLAPFFAFFSVLRKTVQNGYGKQKFFGPQGAKGTQIFENVYSGSPPEPIWESKFANFSIKFASLAYMTGGEKSQHRIQNR